MSFSSEVKTELACVLPENDCCREAQQHAHEMFSRRTEPIYDRLFIKECCVYAFLRGAFLAVGSVTDPKKDYHLEFASPHQQLCRDLLALMEGLGLNPKYMTRKGSGIVYFKESEQIEDLLTMMSATNSSLEIMGVKILKNIRNKANRVTNCETANITKTVDAASLQLEMIEIIYRKAGLDSLPPELREIALERMNNPDMSLRELGEQLSPPLSRSGVNHRLARLKKIADELRGIK